jgi:hypothetical protein
MEKPIGNTGPRCAKDTSTKTIGSDQAERPLSLIVLQRQ